MTALSSIATTREESGWPKRDCECGDALRTSCVPQFVTEYFNGILLTRL